MVGPWTLRCPMFADKWARYPPTDDLPLFEGYQLASALDCG